MGANQSASRTIPLRPRTPLQFGSASTPLPVNSGEFVSSSKLYAPADRSTDDSIFSLLSQESYFGGYAPTPSMTLSEDILYSRTRSISSLSSTSNSSAPHRFICPKQSCPYSIIGYLTSEELEEHIFSANHFHPSSGMDLELGDYDWLPPQEAMEMYPQHPLALQRQQIFEQQQNQKQVRQSQQCNCHHCLHQSVSGSSIKYEPLQPSMQIQMPPPPTIIGYHDAGFELVSWRQPESPYDPTSSPQMNQAEYSSLVQSGMYMDFSQVGAAGRSSFM